MSSDKDEITELKRRIADMQQLCKRAHMILDERWDNYTEDGYGPSGLLMYLERAAGGKEIKDITSYNDRLVRLCNKQADRIVELEKTMTEPYDT